MLQTKRSHESQLISFGKCLGRHSNRASPLGYALGSRVDALPPESLRVVLDGRYLTN
jgi:hypothetical protein